jgi:transcriptional regulator with XRE-family HTH domain
MNQEKIGNFIAECRKNKKLTQEQLAEKLGVTSKSISRWENGNTMPDYALLKDLCNELEINVNEFLSGEKIKESDYMNKAEENFIYLKKKVDRTIQLLKIVTYVCTAIIIALYIANMYFNWLYRAPWDDSTLKMINYITLLIDIPCLIISGMLTYNIKK